MGEWLARRARRFAATTLAMGAVTAVAAGCGSSGHAPAATHARALGGGAPRTTTTSAPATPRVRTVAGRALFRANCAACHTLADARAHGTKAGGEANFDEIRPNTSSVRNFLEHRFGAMPRFRGRLSERQIDTIARYVAEADGCGTASPTQCVTQQP